MERLGMSIDPKRKWLDFCINVAIRIFVNYARVFTVGVKKHFRVDRGKRYKRILMQF